MLTPIRKLFQEPIKAFLTRNLIKIMHNADSKKNQTIIIRKATSADGADIYRWRNDPQSRKMSHNTANIPWQIHKRWMAQSLADGHKLILVASLTKTEEKIGMIRFDISETTALVSINLAPSMRGRGFGAYCLRDAISFFQAKFDKKRKIEAEMKPENIPSKRIFEKAGFMLKSQDHDRLIYQFTS